jgi:hypothetical protein
MVQRRHTSRAADFRDGSLTHTESRHVFPNFRGWSQNDRMHTG